MRVSEVARRLDVSSATVYRLLESGRLKSYRVGTGRGCHRVAEEHLAEYLNGSLGQEAPAVPAPPPVRKPVVRHLRLSQNNT